MTDRQAATDDELWTIGAVTRRTGLTDHTLRAWERRFGFPEPHRLASGHRRYSSDDVRRLILIARALDQGHRAGDVVPMDLDRLRALTAPVAGAGPRLGHPGHWIEAVLAAAREFDGRSIASLLAAETIRLGARAFVRERAAPLMVEIGDRWARGEFGIRHEHFVSEAVEFRLREMLEALRGGEVGPVVVLACLPDESHSLGLLMAGIELAANGVAVRILARSTPLEEIAATAGGLGAAAVGVSISVFADNPTAAGGIAELRQLLPDGMPLWVGGGGAEDLAPEIPGVVVLEGLDALAREVSSLSLLT